MGLVETTVLRVQCPDGLDVMVKAGGAADHHMARELTAYERWTGPWAEAGRCPRMLMGDREAKLLVATWLGGQPVEDGRAEWDRQTYVQAGALLAQFHDQEAQPDAGAFEHVQRERTLDFLGREHRIDPRTAGELAELARQWGDVESVLVPTHGDFHPRNWLASGDSLLVIDFGRAAMRPAASDVIRLSSKQFREDVGLEEAFIEGYGSDPCDSPQWQRLRIAEAVATAVWAHAVGDWEFERHGLRMVAEVAAEALA